MTFTPGIPASGQSLGNSRLQVLNNFAVLRSTIATNHIDVNLAGAGKHNFVEMPVQGTPPVTLATEGGLFTATSLGKSEMFYQRDGVGTNYQMTGSCVIAGNGTTTLFGGIIMNWGRGTIGPGSTVVNFSTAFPTNAFVVIATPFAGGTLTLTGFTINNTGSGSVSYNYIALGN